jgi:hypothetical protein
MSNPIAIPANKELPFSSISIVPPCIAANLPTQLECLGSGEDTAHHIVGYLLERQLTLVAAVEQLVVADCGMTSVRLLSRLHPCLRLIAMVPPAYARQEREHQPSREAGRTTAIPIGVRMMIR